MNEEYCIVVCSLGTNPNLETCLKELILIQESTRQKVEVILVINGERNRDRFHPKVKVYFEPDKGYSNVRNRAVSVCPENSNIIFLDDDEVPTKEWFYHLVKAHETNRKDLLFGPVFPLQEKQVGSYRQHTSQKYRSLNDGDLVKQAHTGNMLIPADLLNQNLIYFDPVFNITGGEDTDLCFRLRNSGVKIRYVQRAVLFERESAERYTIEYLELRRVRDVANYTLAVRRNSSILAILWRFSTLSIRAVLFTLLSPFGSSFISKRIVYLKSLRVLFTARP